MLSTIKKIKQLREDEAEWLCFVFAQAEAEENRLLLEEAQEIDMVQARAIIRMCLDRAFQWGKQSPTNPFVGITDLWGVFKPLKERWREGRKG